MVSSLEVLSGIQLAISQANDVEVKKIGYILSVKRHQGSWFLKEDQINITIWFKAMQNELFQIFEKFPFGLREKIPIHIVIFCILNSLKFAKFHEKNFDLPFNFCYYNFLRISFFNSKGIINKEMAASELVKDTRLSSSIKFCIACYYCFSDVIPGLWEELSEFNRPRIEKGEYKHRLGKGGDNPMVVLWSRYLLGDPQCILEGGKSFSYSKFEQSFENEVTFKNCFEELNDVEKKKAVIFTKYKLEEVLSIDPFQHIQLNSLNVHLPSRSCTAIAISFLHYLDEEQLNQSRNLYLILFHLLSWQYQHLFMDTVKRFWNLLPESEFSLLLERIVCLMENKFFGEFCDYRHILKEFWVQSPSSLKSFFLHSEGEKDGISLILQEQDFTRFGIKYFFDLITWPTSNFIIYRIFGSPSLTDENKELIRLIFKSATSEQKLEIITSQEYLILYMSIKAYDMKPIDLLIECCVPRERVQSFKRKYLNFMHKTDILWDLIVKGKLNELKMFLNWALDQEEIKEFLLRVVSFYFTPKRILSHRLDELKCIEKCLEWSLSSGEIKELKKVVSSVEDIAKHKHELLLKGDFQNNDIFLNWIFDSEIDIKKFKKDLAFEILPYMDHYYVDRSLNLNYVEEFMEWSDLSHEERKVFKKQFSFSGVVIKSYSEFVAQRELDRTDELFEWAELTKSEVKHFKNLLVFNEENNVFSACVYFIVKKNGKEEEVDFVNKLLNWTQFSGEEVGKFYSILAEKLDLKFHITLKNSLTKFVLLKQIIDNFPWSEEEIKDYKRKLGLKCAQVPVEYYVIKNKWAEIEDLLNWCFSYKIEIDEFKKKIPSQVSNLYQNLISNKKFDDIDKFFTWTGIHNSLKKSLLENSIYDERIYKMAAIVLMDGKKEAKSVLSWFETNDLLSSKWRESFLNWCSKNISKKICRFRICKYRNVPSDKYHFRNGCNPCNCIGICSEDLSEISRKIDEYIDRSNDERKRELEPSLRREGGETKRSRRC